MRAERPPQRRVEQMRRGVIAPRRIAALNIDFRCHEVTDAQPVARDGSVRN
jgi:hypothetical protein